MRIGTSLVYAGDPRATADEVASWEEAGLDVLWVAEAYGFDAPTIMGYLAARTTRVEIGSAILPIYSRTPALIAQTAAGLDAVSGGRAILGLGASGPQVVEGWHGVPYDRPVARTRETIEICRAVWRRERLTHDGLHPLPLPGSADGKALKILTRPVRSRIPIYVAALGDRNVRMTASLAEGWLPFLFSPSAAVPASLLEETSLVGPLSYVRDRIAAYREAGVTVLNVTPLGPDPRKLIAQVKELVS